MIKNNSDPEDKIPFGWIDLFKAQWYFLKEDRLKYFAYCLTIILIFSYDLIPPFLIGEIVNFFTSYKPGDSLTKFYYITIGLGVSFTIAAIVRLTIKKKLSFIGTNTIYRIKVEGFEKLMDFSLRWHQDENSGNKVQKIQTGANSIKTFMNILSNQIFRISISLIGILFIFIFLQPIFIIFFILYLILFFMIEGYFMGLTTRANTEYYKSTEKSSGTYYESASNLLTIKTLGLKDNVKQNVSFTEELSKKHDYRIKTLSNTKYQLFQITNGIAITVFFLLLGKEFLNGTILVGAIFVYYTYFQKLTSSASDTSGLIVELIDCKAAISRMMPIFLEKENLHEGTSDFPTVWNEININNGTFRYKIEDETLAITDLNLKIQKNEKIGIVGHSGSGKSTLAKLLLGVYELEKGEFKIGGTNYYDIKHSYVTKHISTVLQETELFNLSLKDNITMMKEVDPYLLQKAIDISQINEIINSLPNGIDTMIGEKGYRLSGGERQRLGIARAIYANTEILILDEATSALDSKTESLIQEAFEKQLSRKTLIIIAHRLSTLKNVDKIYVFEKGRIIEQGKFDDLIDKKDSVFAEMYHLQKNKG